MATLVELEGFRDKLLAARGSGVARVMIQSPLTRRETEFRSDAELAAALADIERRIAALSGAAAVSFVNPRNSRGWS